MKRVWAIFKDLQDSGQQAVIVGHFSIQPCQSQAVTSIDDVHRQPKNAPSGTDENQSPNRTTTEQEQNNDGEKYAVSQTAVLPPELVEVIGSWPYLPDSIKVGILAMVNSIVE